MIPRRTWRAAACIALLAAMGAAIALRYGLPRPRFASGTLEPAMCAAMWQRGVEVEGVVGGRRTQAYFDTARVEGLQEQVSAIVILPDDRSNTPLADIPIGLAGSTAEDACSVRLMERGSDTGRSWFLRIESVSRVTGRRQSPAGPGEPVLFTIVPETRCDGAGPWLSFGSPDWPITFDYPGAWPLTADSDDITVECPSVTRLAFGGAYLTFEQGRFAPRGSLAHNRDDATFTEPFWFVRAGEDDWRVNHRECASAPRAGDACPPARRLERRGLTILQGAAGEHRLHRAGIGYLGSGPGITRYLFIAGDRWVSLDAAVPGVHEEQLESGGGPVLLDGAGVAERLVRSIRRR